MHNERSSDLDYAPPDLRSELVPHRLRPLSGLDAAFLYLEAAGTPMHVGSLMRLEKPRGRRDFRRALVAHLAERLPRAGALRRTLEPAPLDIGHPLWREGSAIDLDEHVVARRVRAPGGERQLLDLVAKLHAAPLPRDRPLWQFCVIDGLADGTLALHTKVHHALLDGQGGIALAQALLDVAPAATAKRGRGRVVGEHASRLRRRDVATVAARSTVNAFARLMRAIPAGMKLARGAAGNARAIATGLRDGIALAPRTPFNGQCSAARSYATVSLPLAGVKALAQRAGASLNDVVLATCAGALRELLARRGALPREPLVAAMPVSLRASGDATSNNQVSMTQVPLATDRADPRERLAAIRAATAQVKQRVASFRELIPQDFPGLAAPIWASGLSRLWARGRIAERLPPLGNLVVSNVPGPPVPLYIAGARIVHNHPVSIVTHGLGLNITINGYAEWLEIGVLACRAALPDARPLARGIERAYQELLGAIPA
jgi:diacylglycerol O-acyltransferase / wax synthase